MNAKAKLTTKHETKKTVAENWYAHCFVTVLFIHVFHNIAQIMIIQLVGVWVLCIGYMKCYFYSSETNTNTNRIEITQTKLNTTQQQQQHRLIKQKHNRVPCDAFVHSMKEMTWSCLCGWVISSCKCLFRCIMSTNQYPSHMSCAICVHIVATWEHRH